VLREYRRRSSYFKDLFGKFPQQATAVLDQAPLKTYRTPRRAGKTTAAVGGDIIWDAIQHADRGHQYAFVALTRHAARGITWNMMKKLDREYGLGARFLEGQLRVVLPGGTEITLHGADKAGWADRLLGHEFRKVIIDEAGFYSIDLKKFIEELEPTVIGTGGSIVMCSTPGHIPRGHYYDVTTGKVGGWSNHRWSSLDNPYIRAKVLATIARHRKEDPDIENRAWYRRNFLGEWVTEFENKVYRFDLDKNTWNQDLPGKSEYMFVLGVDLGWHDATAFCVIGWHPHRPELVVFESHRQQEMLISDVAKTVKMYEDFYPGLIMVGDPAHRQAFEELRRRWKLPIREAEKTSKDDWQALINTDLSNEIIKVVDPDSSVLAEEWMELAWYQRPDGTLVEAPRQPNDVADAFLYAYHIAYHYRHTEAVIEPVRASKEYYDAQVERMLEEAERNWERDNALNDMSWLKK